MEMRLSVDTVSKVVKLKNELKNAIDVKTTLACLSKDEIQKLKFIDKYSPKQLEEIFYRLSLNNKQEIDKTIGEP
jgi:hypothetical protein